RVTGGKLAGLVNYRIDALDSVQNNLGRLALGLAHSVNAAHAQGVDLALNPATDFFSIGEITVLPSSRNSAGAPDVTVSLDDVNKLTAEDFRIAVQRDAAGNPVSVQLNTLPNGAVNTFPTSVPSELEIGGITLTLDSGVPGAGSAADSWLIQPPRSAGSTL